MLLWNKIPGKPYFISMFFIGAFLFCAFSTVIYRHYERAQNLNAWTLYNYEVVRQSRRILMHLVDMETGVRGYILTSQKSFLEPYEASRAAVPGLITQLRQYTKDDDTTQDNVDLWLEKAVPYIQALQQELDNFKTLKGKGVTVTTLDKLKVQMDELRGLLESYIQTRIEKLQEQIKRGSEGRENFRYILIIGVILAVGVMLLATLIILGLITRAQNASKATVEAEERFRLVMNGINDGLYDYSVADNKIYFSSHYKTMLGYTEEEHPDTLEASKRLIHPDDLEEAMEITRKYQAREVPIYANTFRMRHKNGNWRWILSRGVGFWDSKGKIQRMVGTHMDITDQKKREEELEQANSDLETFTYIASHDLRSPLVNLKGFAKELKHAVDNIQTVLQPLKANLPLHEQKAVEESLDKDIPEALNFIEKSTDRMDTLTTALLDLSRIGKREYHMEVVDAEAIVNKCIGAQRYEIEQRKAEVICETLPPVFSDALALEQVFSNLLDNAVKYLDPSRPGRIVVSARERPADVIFSVADNGRGIVQEDQRRIFEMFRRARNADDVRGLGMGMSFVKATLRKLGGAIWCESTFGGGTTFFFRLPKQPVKE